MIQCKTGIILALFFAAASVAFASQAALADELAEAGQRALADKRFPWFDSTSNSITEMQRTDPGRAKTLNRAELPVYEPMQQNVTPAQRPVAETIGFSYLSTLIWIAIAIIFVLIAGALVWFFMQMEGRLGRDLRSREAETALVHARIKQLPFDMPYDSGADFRELAARAAAQGDYGRATILLFSHVLLHLDQKDLIRLKKGKTNRQYLRELQAHSQLSNYFHRVMVTFEDAFFGDHPIQQPVFEAAWNDLDSFQEQVSQRLRVGS